MTHNRLPWTQNQLNVQVHATGKISHACDFSLYSHMLHGSQDTTHTLLHSRGLAERGQEEEQENERH